MFKPDVLVEINYDLASPDKSVIRTNARMEALEEILDNWVRDQMFRERRQYGEPTTRKTYRIRIGLRIADDTFACESDTGNHALTVGIVADVYTRLSKLKVEGLS